MYSSDEDANSRGDRLEELGSEGGSLDETSFSIGLGKTGKGEYHVRNDPSAPYQRQSVIENPGILEIQCKSREIIHGRLSPEPDEYATLLVYDIHLESSKRSRRITSAAVKFEFSSSEPGQPSPKVLRIAPFRKWSVSPSTQQEATTVGGELSIGAEFVANVGATAKWEKTVSRTTEDEAQVTGSIWSDDFGNPRSAKWVLTENRSTKSGVPSFFRCAILLGRSHNGLFESQVMIEVDSDWKSKVERLFGSTPRDDPVLFDPEFPPTNKLRKQGYDMDNLESLDLHAEFAAIRFSAAFTPGQRVEA
ncbi:hypothetical protein QBC42DRAFT_277227 [Cladorrhinum samala]|uniref:Uncharacterized protein n=1 Tax=Cladorrhinum samala TaxID=585594 RepID=A0AAV9HAZ0_9PEZI|nr:hypothetical protein QBC42DRAFT_277227 [Cladorrhinum samala]